LINYPLWLECLFNRIFNDIAYLNIFESRLNLITSFELHNILEIVEQESSHHVNLINKIRSQVK